MAEKRPLSPEVVRYPGDFSHSFIHTRGIRLHVAAAGDPTHPLVVCIHDAFGAWFDYADLLPLLAEQGFYAIAVDLRGYGLSDKPPQISIRDHVSDLSGLIASLGADKATLIGADTGASLAWTLATQEPERVEKIISIASAHPVDLRRAVIAHPWKFLWIITRHFDAHLPRRNKPKAMARRIFGFMETNTHAGFLKTTTGKQHLERRREHVRVGGVANAMILTSRILIASVSPRQLSAKATVSVLQVHAAQSLWKGLDGRVDKRTSGATDVLSIEGAKNLPHIETPQAFMQAISYWL